MGFGGGWGMGHDEEILTNKSVIIVKNVHSRVLEKKEKRPRDSCPNE